MPPASRNQRVPTGGDTPAPIAASSLDRPAAINAQKRSRSSRRAIPGRPGDLNLSRNARSERRLPAIATFLPVVLRRPLESALAATVGMMDQPCSWAAHDEGFAERLESQVPVQPVAGRPTDNPTCEQVDDDCQIEPSLAGPDIGNVGAPFLVRPRCGEVLIEQIGGDRPGVMAVSRPFEPPLLPGPEAVLAHQAGRPSA